MQKGFRIVVTDTSCFIILEKINSTSILKKLFDQVYTTPEVAEEFGLELPEWVTIKSAENVLKQAEFKLYLDPGESSAIALALELNSDFVLIDDLGARKFAEKLGLSVKGSVGLLLSAKQKGIIPLLRPYLEFIQETNFRISGKIIAEVLKEAGE